MRKITKTHAPALYLDWARENRGGAGYTYNALPVPVKRSLKDQLLKEQGFLCAYTGREIRDTTSHLEHLKPQSCCQQGEDVDYRNLVACFPDDGGDTRYGYGAPVKGAWWDATLFVSPLSAECERRFSYTWSGKVSPFRNDDQAAAATIKRLALDHTALNRLRKQAIRGFFGFTPGAVAIDKAEAHRLFQGLDKPNLEGQLPPFCFVLKQMLKRLLPAKDSQCG